MRSVVLILLLCATGNSVLALETEPLDFNVQIILAPSHKWLESPTEVEDAIKQGLKDTDFKVENGAIVIKQHTSIVRIVASQSGGAIVELERGAATDELTTWSLLLDKVAKTLSTQWHEKMNTKPSVEYSETVSDDAVCFRIDVGKNGKAYFEKVLQGLGTHYKTQMLDDRYESRKKAIVEDKSQSQNVHYKGKEAKDTVLPVEISYDALSDGREILNVSPYAPFVPDEGILPSNNKDARNKFIEVLKCLNATPKDTKSR